MKLFASLMSFMFNMLCHKISRRYWNLITHNYGRKKDFLYFTGFETYFSTFLIRAILKPTKISSVASQWIFVRTFFWQCFDNLERLTQGQNKHRTCLHSNLFVCKRIQNVLLTCNDCFLMLATMVIFEYHAIFWDAHLKLKLLNNLHFIEM